MSTTVGIGTDATMAESLEEQRWLAVARRESERSFVYAVSTTGIYCRPGCPARTPLRVNVRYFVTPAEARAAGFRSCKRCHPDVQVALSASSSEPIK